MQLSAWETTYSKRCYEITAVWEIHISRLELQRCPLVFVISFSKVYTVVGIWEWGLANSFCDHVIQISIIQINFQYIFPYYEQLKSFLETFSPYNQILIFDECVCLIWIYIFDTDETQINRACMAVFSWMRGSHKVNNKYSCKQKSSLIFDCFSIPNFCQIAAYIRNTVRPTGIRVLDIR